jgi:hypothetical protein
MYAEAGVAAAGGAAAAAIQKIPAQHREYDAPTQL